MNTVTSPDSSHARTLDSPIGPLCVRVDADGRLMAIDFKRRADDDPLGRAEAVVDQLREYFAGERHDFDLELSPIHGTGYQRRVWERLAAIPYGETRSYRDLARALRSSPRAVGQANGRNPIPIVVPCHRVVAADGSLGGYAGGLATKRALLQLEGIAID